MMSMHPELTRIVEEERDRERAALRTQRSAARRQRGGGGWVDGLVGGMRRALGRAGTAPLPQAAPRTRAPRARAADGSLER
jgi:hypothetical protein